ncbi:MAG: two-component sensor histidine kinase [Martelella sp.]|uniref:sensor histidine kinase n=1 Tax=unclassified Martelella TaxID=2629616 RepID=UPI000C401280|nr:HAMP domain-containing sensor histidine kinase [Martelella sp.]MAU23647.1 two-component sensor histidine kinase [Martelella sp.]
MRAGRQSNPSLRWRLSWQLSLVISVVIAGVILGLCVYGTMVLSPNVAMEQEVKSAVAGAIERDRHGTLALRETPALRLLMERNDRLWFVAATTDGASLSRGTVPANYAAISPLVSLFHSADIRGASGVREIASIEDVETPIGEVRILFGGIAGKGWPVFTIFKEAYPIYLSLLAIALPAIFLAVPRIVGHAIARVSDVADMASQIEPHRHGDRLPVAGIPKEVAPLVIAFNGALDRIENEFRKRQRFLIDAAHELRTPIAIVQTRIEGLSEGPERRRLLDDVARLADMAEQLLDFERGNQTIDLDETVDLVDIARTAVADLAPLAIAAGYEMSFHGEAECVERKGDSSALRRAIGNLIRNAIEHAGGYGTITVSALADGEISVSDEGPGIPADQQDLVFEPFYRVVPNSRGAGLGLSLVKQIVEKHGGHASIESGSYGTKVTMRL